MTAHSVSLSKALALFERQHAAGEFPGGQLVVRQHGALVCDRSIGIARGYRRDECVSPLPVSSRTAFPAYSCGKPLAAIAIALLEDRGRLDPNAPVAEVFPEFAAYGKAAITVLDVLTHRSGVVMPQLLAMVEQWPDREVMAQAVASAIPAFPRGTLAYAPWEFGFILSEIVRRVAGKTLAEFFADEIATPLQLPALRFGFANRDPQSIAHSYWLGKDVSMVAGVNVAADFERTNNHRAYFDSLNPACSLITDASSLAIVYDFLLAGGVSGTGQRLLSQRILQRYATRNVFAFDRSLRTFLAVGRGFVLGTWPPSMFGWWNTAPCFGHAGAFSCFAGADPRSGVSIAILTNGNRGLNAFAKRFIDLNHKIRAALR